MLLKTKQTTIEIIKAIIELRGIYKFSKLKSLLNEYKPFIIFNASSRLSALKKIREKLTKIKVNTCEKKLFIFREINFL